MKIQHFIISILLLSSLLSCGGDKTARKGTGAQVLNAETFADNINDEFGYRYILEKCNCLAISGDYWVVAKNPSLKAGTIVISQRVGNSRHDYRYVAIDIRGWDGSSSAYVYLSQQLASGSAVDNLKGEKYPGLGTDWDRYRDLETDFVYDETSGFYKDLEKIGSQRNLFEKQLFTETLANEFGLSADRAIKVTSLINSLEEYKKSPRLNGDDLNYFSNELLGVDVSAILKVYQDKISKENQPFEDLIEKAARINENTPEQMNNLFQKLFLN